jgi:hypothetical protein
MLFDFLKKPVFYFFPLEAIQLNGFLRQIQLQSVPLYLIDIF